MNAQVAARRWGVAVRLMAVSAVWSAGVLLAALLLPVDNGNVDNGDGVTLTRITLVQDHGLTALVLVIVPLVACAVVARAMVARRRDDAPWSTPSAWGAVGVVVVEAILGILSVGAFFIPVAIALAVAVRLAPPWADVRS